MLRIAKIVLIVFVGLWGLFGAMTNILGWQDTLGGVGTATSMASVTGGEDSWKATTSPIVIWVGAVFIVGSKLAAAVLCGLGAWRMWGARAADVATFQAAKHLALTGCAVAAVMLFGGFVVIAEGWFEFWRSSTIGSAVLATAFRYGAMILLVGLFVSMPDE